MPGRETFGLTFGTLLIYDFRKYFLKLPRIPQVSVKHIISLPEGIADPVAGAALGHGLHL